MSVGYSLGSIKESGEVFHRNLSNKLFINYKHLIIDNFQIGNSGSIVLLTEIDGLHSHGERPVEVDDARWILVIGEHKN